MNKTIILTLIILSIFVIGCESKNTCQQECLKTNQYYNNQLCNQINRTDTTAWNNCYQEQQNIDYKISYNCEIKCQNQ